MLRRSLILGQFSTTVRPYFVAFQRSGVQELKIVSRPYASDSSGRDRLKCETPSEKAPVYNADCKRPRDTSCDDNKGYPCGAFGKQPEPSNKPPCGSSMRGMMPEPEPDPEKVRKRNLWLLLGMLVVAGGLYKMIDWKNLFTTAKEPKRVEVGKPKAPRKLVKKPSSSNSIPDEVPYLLIGGGTASFSAFRAIKSLEPQAKVLVVTSEPYNPYMRPPLSKEMFYGPAQEGPNALNFKQWNGTERSLFYEPDDFYMGPNNLHKEENGGVAVAQGWTVTKLDVVNRVATLDDGKKIKYNKCLIATGAVPRTMPVFQDAIDEVKDKISLYRGIHDYEDIESVIASGAKTIAIFGSGFLGSELACSLARRGRSQNMKVVQVYKENGNMSKILPKYLSDWTTKKVKAEGVEIHPNTEIDDIDVAKSKKEIVLMLSNKKKIIADHLIVAVGVEPNTELALTSHLETDSELGGYLVNAELEARSGLYVAGDAACFYDVKLGRRRVEHHDHAVVSGRLAGENMTGAAKPYWHQSMFWSDLGPDVGFEAIGIVDSSLPTYGVYTKSSGDDNPKAATKPGGDGMRSSDEERDGEPAAQKTGDAATGAPKPGEEYGKGVIFYLKDDIIVGIVLWNVFNRMQVARQVLMEEQKFDDLNEVAKLFNIHASDTQTDSQTATN